MYEKILYDLDDQVAFIRMNDPNTLNAMSTEMALEMIDAFDRAEAESRAIVLGSVGRAFCSGANLVGGTFNLESPDRDAGLALERAINPLLLKIRNSTIPVVTAVRGAAAGVGCGLALTGDLIIAGENSYFYQAFCNVGLSPDGGSTYLLAKAIGRVRAMEVMLLGERLYANRALDWGLVSRVVDENDVDSEALEVARRLSEGPKSLGQIRDTAWSALDTPFERQLENERIAQRESGRTEDFLEGVAAFKEKRSPKFTGH